MPSDRPGPRPSYAQRCLAIKQANSALNADRDNHRLERRDAAQSMTWLLDLVFALATLLFGQHPGRSVPRGWVKFGVRGIKTRFSMKRHGF